MTIFVEDSFDSAHWLPEVPEGHKCKRMHGHTYRVRLEISGKVDPVTGWVIDYAELKAKWLPIKDQLDHRLLNDFIDNPTCENIAKWIGVTLGIHRVELRETVNCGVVWEPE